VSNIEFNLSVVTDDPQVVARTTEHFARMMSGLALDGVECALTIGPEFDIEFVEAVEADDEGDDEG